jgi:hypothetical protein
MLIDFFLKVKLFIFLFQIMFDKPSDIYYKYPIIFGGVIIDQVQFVNDPRLEEDD